MVLDRS